MNIVDRLYTEWAWRSKTGLPDIKNPEDKAILDSILEELGAEDDQNTEPQPETTPKDIGDDYDEAIKKEFDGEIPEVLGL